MNILKRLVISVLFAIFLFSFPVFAQDKVSIILSAKNIVGYTGERTEVDAIIENQQSIKDKFSISIWPPYWGGISVKAEKYLVEISKNSNQTIKIYFDIAVNADEIYSPFNLSVRSLNDESISDFETLKLTVIRKDPIYISDIKLDKYTLDPQEELKIDIHITNLDEDVYEQATLETNIKKDGITVYRFDDLLKNLPGKDTQKIEHLYTFDKYAEPGVYSVEATLKDILNRIIGSKNINLRLNAISNITHRKVVSYGLMLQTITIKVKNEGNVPSTSFYVTEEIPSFMRHLFYPIGHYTSEVAQDRIFYHWLIPDLIPREERIIKYQINLWNVWIIILVVIVCTIFAFRYVYGPKIVKKFTHFGAISTEKEITISLDVRNRSRHDIKDVIVKDFVPSIVKVVGKFGTVKPSLKKTEIGTELTWKFKSLGPKEERVLTYAIKPVVEIMGTLKLPHARIRYVDKKKVRKTIASKRIVIKAR